MHSPRIRSPGPSNGALSGPSGRGRKTGLKSRATQVMALRFGWVVLVVWFEVGDFFHSLSTCKFPDSVLRQSTSTYNRTPPAHIVLISDPHVPHPRLSYSSGSRPWINVLRQGMDELFMRKSWNVVMRLGRVDAVIVVGDMLDWGRGVMSDQEYEEYYNLFRSIFTLPSTTPMFYVPGNHDIPLGPHRLFSPHARERYSKHFSPPNEILSIANHSLILLDAVGLVEEDYRRYAAEMQFGEWDGVAGGVIEFVKALGDEPPPAPRILISHIPLARPEAASCGVFRESGRIVKGAGPGYQNLLGSETSRFLLNVLRPSIVFSGDDHDYCEHVHPSGIREVTLKSFSTSTGIRTPGFQLLSLIPPSNTEIFPAQLTHADRPCFLPDQLGVYYRVYIPLAICTVLYLVLTNIRSAWNRLSNGGGLDLKGRLSPNMAMADQLSSTSLSARRASDRPGNLNLPSRKSSQHLTGLSVITPGGSMQPRSARQTTGFMTSTSSRVSSRSAPVSPNGSPHLGITEVEHTNGYGGGATSRFSYSRERDEEIEIGSQVTTPNLSRRNSYTPEIPFEPASYLLPIPSGPIGSVGLGITPSSSSSGISGLGGSGGSGSGSNLLGPGSSSILPNPVLIGQPTRRLSSTNLNQIATGSSINPPLRRVTMPRMLSTSDWASAAKAKEKSVFGLMVDSLPGGTVGGGNVGGRSQLTSDWVWGFFRWLWRARNGVVGKSWSEVIKVAWPAAVVWVLVNALFFVS